MENTIFIFRGNAIMIGGMPVTYDLDHIINHLYPSVAYDYDSMVWCVPRARVIPKWQNALKVFKGFGIMCFILGSYYLYVGLAYVHSYTEDLDMDSHSLMLVGFRMCLGSSTKYDYKDPFRRMLLALTIISSLVICIHFASFYVAIFNSTILQPQIDSWTKVEEGRHQLAMDRHTAELLGDSQMVIKNYLILIQFHNLWLLFLKDVL